MSVSYRKTDSKPVGTGRQFSLRRMMLAVTLIACTIAALSGAFGWELQIVMILSALVVLFLIGFTFVMAAPWIALMWCCTSIVELLTRWRGQRRDS